MPLPVAGTGIVPASGGIYNELQSVVRRAFVPNLFVQLYQANPVLSFLLRNAQRARGGLNQITVPIQGNPFVSWSYAGYDGGFPQPQVTPAVQNAQFNLILGVIPIPFVGMEAIIQSSETIINLCKARLTDAKTVALQKMAGDLYTLNTANPLRPDSLVNAFDAGTNAAAYGGISRAWTARQRSGRQTPTPAFRPPNCLACRTPIRTISCVSTSARESSGSGGA